MTKLSSPNGGLFNALRNVFCVSNIGAPMAASFNRSGLNLYAATQIQEIHMLQFLKRLFCIHAYDYESDIFIQVECRKCSKTKQPSSLR